MPGYSWHKIFKVKNMSNTNIKKINDSEIEIEVELAADKFEHYYNEVIAHFGKNLKIDGFRAGHIPENIVSEKVGEMSIMEEMATRAISDWYPKFLLDEKIDAIGRPEIAITKIARNNPLSFKVKQSVMPPINLPDYKAIADEVLKNHKEEEIVITDEEIAKITDELRKQRKQNPNDEKEITPALDDEFAKSLGDFKSKEDLINRIKDNLRREKEMVAESKRREAIVKAIVESVTLDVPEPFVHREQDAQIAQTKADIARMGVNFEDYLKQVGKTESEIRDEIREQASKRAKTNLIIEAIAGDAKIEVSQDELDKEVKRMLEVYKDADPMAVKQYVENVLKNEEVFKLLENRS